MDLLLLFGEKKSWLTPLKRATFLTHRVTSFRVCHTPLETPASRDLRNVLAVLFRRFWHAATPSFCQNHNPQPGGSSPPWVKVGGVWWIILWGTMRSSFLTGGSHHFPIRNRFFLAHPSWHPMAQWPQARVELASGWNTNNSRCGQIIPGITKTCLKMEKWFGFIQPLWSTFLYVKILNFLYVKIWLLNPIWVSTISKWMAIRFQVESIQQFFVPKAWRCLSPFKTGWMNEGNYC